MAMKEEAAPVAVVDEPVVGARKWWILAILALSLSMIVLDGTIVGVSLPVIIQDLHLNLVDAQWVNALYSVVFAALLLMAGSFGDRRGRRKGLLVGLILFMVGSFLAGWATSAGTLIAARAIQGVGGAFVMPSTLSSVNAIFRGRDRIIAFAVWGATMSAMAAIGPLLGGWITTDFTWPWIFMINLPIGIALAIAAIAIMPENRAENVGKGFDLLGMLLSALGFGLTVFGLIEGNDLGWWDPKQSLKFGDTVFWASTHSISIVPLAIGVGLVLLVCFGFWELHRTAHNQVALLDLSLFKIGTFAWGNLAATMVAVGEFAIVFVLPLYLVNVLSMTTLQAGWVLAGMAAGAIISGAAARHLAARMGAAQVVVSGLALEIVGVLGAAWLLGPATNAWAITGLMAIYGAGLGLAAAQLTSTILQDVPVVHSGMGSATQSTVRQLGSAMGAAIAGTVLAVSLSNHLPTVLGEIRGLPPESAGMIAETTTQSAGGFIQALSHMGTHSPAGPATPQVVEALQSGFAHAASVDLSVAAIFLAIGLIAAIILARLASRQKAAS